jgi:integrase/recombinase XerD
MGQRSPRRPIRLPKNLTSVQLEDFFAQVKKSGNSTHEVLFQILYATGCRVSEICNAMRDDGDIEGGKIFVRQGKGAKDRIVLFPTAMRLPMRLYMDATKENLYLFESRRRQKLSTRWVQTLAKTYGEKAGIPDMHPHRLRHTLLTQLASDLTDAQLQAVSGHASRSSLNIYTQLSQRDVADKYEQLMR